MKELPKITIVTPTYNCAALIRTCIQSVQDQGYPNLEHIIVDGASKDGTVDILKEYPHIRWISEPDHGEAEALNKALRMATGNVIGWLNADDCYLPNILSQIGLEFSGREERHLVYGKTVFIDEDGVPTNWVIPAAPIDLVTLTRWFNLNLFQPSIFFSHELIEQVGFYREDLKFGCDYEYWFRIASKGYRFDYIDRVFAESMIYRSGGKTETPYVIKAGEWLEICKSYAGHLTPGERLHFWKDYYVFRLSMHEVKFYYDGAPINPPETEEAQMGFLLAAKELSRLNPEYIHRLLARSPYPITPDMLGLMCEIYQQYGLPEAQKALDAALSMQVKN